ncbi:MAG: ATP-binding protein [Hyphomonadaceae bacterium]
MPPTMAAPPVITDSAFGSVRAVVADFFTGRLRRRFYSDVRQFSNDPDATRQVAAGYMCLAAAVGWLANCIAVGIVNPTNVIGLLLGALNFAGSLHGFLQIRRRRDPRAVLDWMVLSYFAAVAILSYRQAGIVAPVLMSIPAAVGISAMYVRPRMRPFAIGLGIAVFGFAILTSTGLIGIHATYTTNGRSVMYILSIGFATIALGCIAWISNMSREFAVEQLKAANETIVENAARSRVALEAARVGLWDVPDASQRKFHVSESFQTVTGYSGEEFDGLFGNVEKFVHPEDVVSLREAFALGRKRMSRLRVDFRLLTRQRGYRWFSARARYSQNADGTVRISGSLQDINFIKAAEEALRSGRDRAREANKAKSDFIAMMSHEVRTPLNAIMGSVEVLKRKTHDRDTAELVALIDEAGTGLLTIVSDLLDVSKIDAGKLEITPTPTDLPGLVKRTLEFWGPQASDKGLTLKVDCSEAGPTPLMLDAGRVRQIVGNLISNAIKFTETGSVTARVSTHETSEGRIEIALSVIDTGPGVPDAVAETIFAPFEQAPGSVSKGGTGLGLFISRRLARLMGGDLTLEPARRDGAHFRLSLVTDRADTADVAGPHDSGEPAWHGRTVLCVDDNEKNRRIAELLLSKFGIEVTGCASGAEAMDICAIQTFDVILMDIVMPEMDGMETLRRLRSDPECLNRMTPAIALTAKLSQEDIAAYAASGFDGVAAKPIDVRQLALAIAPFMDAVSA